jgi:P-type Mg2+ transporter
MSDHSLELIRMVQRFNGDGFRVILVATRDISIGHTQDDNFHGLDIDLTAEGLLTFLDPLKDDAQASVVRLRELGVDTRILTGDNLGVAMKICSELKLVEQMDEVFSQAITEPELAKLEDTETFHKTIKHCKVFAKLTPIQKGQVIDSLKGQGEVVGMLGDGINDSLALRKADAGISVHKATNVAKDSADVVLTSKDLAVITDCFLIGRIIQGNT